MPDDKQEDAPPDPERINTHDETHMVYWSKKWIISCVDSAKPFTKRADESRTYSENSANNLA